MKNVTTTMLLLLLPLMTMAQISFELNGMVNKTITSYLKEGTPIILKSIDPSKPPYEAVSILYNDTEIAFDINKLNLITFNPSSIKDFWLIQAINHDVYQNAVKNGMQYKLRKDLEEETFDFLNYTENNNMIFHDSYLESYLYALAYKIYPNRIEDGRPGILNIKILKSVEPNAFMFPNGTMFITTGLLSTINSEDELIGIMAHEIAHFVLDHSIININKGEQRQKKAEFWAAFVTGIAAAADVYTAANNEYYIPGSITMGTAIIAFSIASELNERMGLKYSREQEMEADKCATELMQYIKVDPAALASALIKLKNYSIQNGNYLALTGEGTHPAIDIRINNIGESTKEFNDSKYDKTISFVNSFNAIAELNNHHLQACASLVKRNIDSDVATEEDYVLLAMVTTFMYDNEIKNNEALDHIKTAKSLNISPSINISKQEAIILIRLGKFEEAKKSLENYHSALENERVNLANIKNTNEWSYVNEYLFNENEWTVKMINKVGKMR